MKNKPYSDAQIIRCPAGDWNNRREGVLREAESGVPVSELCREHGMSSASYYKWRAKFGGMPSR